MYKKRFWKTLSVFLCIVLIAAVALITTGCQNNTIEPEEVTETVTSEETFEDVGTGETSFIFKAEDTEGKITGFRVFTDKTTVGEALQETGLISGDEGAYGLYVKTVNGTTLDYDTDKMYWAFFIDGSMAPSGVDQTEIESGKVYSFVPQK